jgi:hypothetical protein
MSCFNVLICYVRKSNTLAMLSPLLVLLLRLHFSKSRRSAVYGCYRLLGCRSCRSSKLSFVPFGAAGPDRKAESSCLRLKQLHTQQIIRWVLSCVTERGVKQATKKNEFWLG